MTVARRKTPTTVAERVHVTMHAIRRWQGRIDRSATDAEARDAILLLLQSSHVDRQLAGGVVQMRARGRRWPGRVRIRIGPGDGHAIAVLTVLGEHDGWRSR